MAQIERWNPFQELERVRESLLSSGWLAPLRFPTAEAWGPAIDVKETPSDIIVYAEVPGINPDDLEVVVEEGGLTVRGEIRQDIKQSEEGYHRVERRYGRFHRAIPFPVPVKPEQAVAQYRDGILEIRAPKADIHQRRGRRLNITRGDTPQLH